MPHDVAADPAKSYYSNSLLPTVHHDEYSHKKLPFAGEADGTCTSITYKVKGPEHYMAPAFSRDRLSEAENFSKLLRTRRYFMEVLHNSSDSSFTDHNNKKSFNLAHVLDHCVE